MDIKKPGVFISYSHEDRDYFNKLKKHINNESCSNVEIWDDSRIEHGQNWDKEIKKNLKDARFVLFLISQSFLMSKYIKYIEIKETLKRHEENDCEVIPVFLSSFNSSLCPEILSMTQGVASPDETIADLVSKNKHGDIERAYVNLAAHLKNKAEELLKHEKNKFDYLENLENNHNIYLSIGSSDYAMDNREDLIAQINKKIRRDKWPYRVIPDFNDAQEILKLPLEEKRKRIQSLIKQSIYSIHIFCSEDELKTEISRLEYDLAKQENESKTTTYKNIIWFLDSELQSKLKGDDKDKILSNPSVLGTYHQGIFDLISDLDIEKEKEIKKMKSSSSPGKGIYLCYDYDRDHDNELRIFMKNEIEKEKIELSSSLPGLNMEEEKKAIEECRMAIIFYGQADKSWFSFRQHILKQTNVVEKKVIFLDKPEIDKKLRRDTYQNPFTIVKIENELRARFPNNASTDSVKAHNELSTLSAEAQLYKWEYIKDHQPGIWKKITFEHLIN